MSMALTTLQVLALIIAGMAYALLGSIKVPLARKLNIDEAKIGGLISIFGFTLIPMALVAGMLCDFIGRQFVFSSGFGLILAGLVILANAKKYSTAMLSVFVFGTGWATAVNALNGLQAPAFLKPEDIPEKIHFAMNLGDFIFGMGTFIAPVLFAIMIKKFGLKVTLIAVGIIAGLPLIIQTQVDWAPLAIPQTAGFLDSMAALVNNPIVWLCSLGMFFLLPIEFSVASWSTTLMMDKNISENRAATILSTFWLSFLISRLVIAFYLPENYASTLLIALGILCTLATAGIVISRSATMTSLLVIVLGTVLGPLFPTLIALLVGHVEPALQGRAIGLFFCLGGIGCTLVPLLVGATAKKKTLQSGFIFITGSAAILTALCITLHLSI